jgi:hypothetical protein
MEWLRKLVQASTNEEDPMGDSNNGGEILARCGFRCDLCPAYEKNGSGPEELTAIRSGWRSYFGFDVPEEQIACAGCLNEGRHPDADCPVRPCAIERRMETCADCPDFGCGKLKSRMDFAESAMTKFRIVPDRDFRSFFLPYLSRERLERIHQNRRKT